MISYYYLNETVTFAVDINSLSQVNPMSVGNEVSVYMGMALKHPEDNFNKDIGRSVAASRLANVIFKCNSCHYMENNDSMVYHLYSDTLYMKIYCKKGKPYFRIQKIVVHD